MTNQNCNNHKFVLIFGIEAVEDQYGTHYISHHIEICYHCLKFTHRADYQSHTLGGVHFSSTVPSGINRETMQTALKIWRKDKNILTSKMLKEESFDLSSLMHKLEKLALLA
jgi:hypothetical protein